MDRKGYIFLSSDVTEPECIERMLFGGKEGYKSRVKGLEKGDILFLYNYNSKRFIGIFEAESELQENIMPDAWKGEFPWQVKVKRLEHPKPITREDVGTLLKFDRAGRPTSRLTPEIVEALIALFKGEKRIHQYEDSAQLYCDDGHKVRSLPEQKICNWLFAHQIPHAYEYPIPEAKRCDFYVPDDSGGTYIEYWGLSDKEYLENRIKKQEIYRNNKLTLINIEVSTPRNLSSQIDSKLGHLISKF